MIPKPREVFLVPFPFSDASASKQRPAMVISTEKYAKETDLCIVCALSTNETLLHSFRIVDSDLEYGSLYGHSSAVLYGSLFTVKNGLLGKKVLKLKAKTFSAIVGKLQSLIAN
jgi:mRNA interferase MazF